jgi:hypothetical protein
VSIELAERLNTQAEHLVSCVWNEAPTEALAALGAVWQTLSDLAPELVEMGVHAGLTQRRMADLLGVPASTLRGAKREFAR